MSIQIQRPPNESWDCMLPGPPSRSNGGSADISPAGLFAYSSGSSVSVVETHSMQLVTTIPLPPPTTSTSSLSPFITSVKWSPQPLPHLIDIPQHHLLLAVGDRQGRICLLDFRSKSPTVFFDTGSGSGSKLGIQDLCWVQTGPDSWILAALCGPSLLSLYNTSTGRCFFKYDASPEYFSCLRRDPFDSRHFCALGLKGFLLSVTALGDTENDVVLKELQIRTDASELLKLERDSSSSATGGGNGAPVSATFPTYMAKFAFSPHWRHLMFVVFPRELVVFDLQYETALFSAGLPRGCGKFLEVLPDSNIEVLYCAHLDGKISTWRRKDGEQVHTMCAMEELMPSIGTSVPSPSILAAVISHSDAALQNIGKLYSDAHHSVDVDFDNPFDFCDESLVLSKTRLISISDDGKVWKWLLTAEGSLDVQKDMTNPDIVVDACKTVPSEIPIVHNSGTNSSSRISLSKSPTSQDEVSFKGTEKAGGYINRLVVTCLRSGLNRPFRVLQKPERAPIRALRASSSGRYLLILFRDAPVEVWAMTKTPIMLRSLALPFTVLEWTLPTVPRPLPKDRPAVPSTETSSPTKAAAAADAKGAGTDGSQDEFSESFSFALVNGALGVFEVHGRRIRDFRPKWPSSSFVSSEGLVTAMAYRLPHVVMGDRSGNIRWWDVTTGQSSSFNTHREGIRRIKFSPVVPGDRSRGRIAVLFYDNTFSVFDLDSPDPLANSLLQPQFPGTLVLELDWLPLRSDKNDPLVLCIAGADSSFRLVEVNISDNKMVHGPQARPLKERFRPMPLCSPILLPTPHALALRTILQLGVKPSWFNTWSTTSDDTNYQVPGTPTAGDLRNHMIESPRIGDSVVPEMLLKVLEPYRREGCILNDETVRLYAGLVDKGSAVRFAFAAAIFGEPMEALFWLQLPRALNYWMNRLTNKSPTRAPQSASTSELDEASMLNRISSKGKSGPGTGKNNALGNGQLQLMAFEQQELWERANEQIPWHEKLEGEEAIQNRVHELVSIGNLEAAVSLLLSTPPESSYFYANALRAVALSSAVSTSLLELAVKVVAANMVRTDRSLSGTHLLCAVGRYQEACSQLQDAGCWTDAATLAATHLKGTDYARVLLRWAQHVLHSEHNIWRALILYVAAGALPEALAALRGAQQPDTAAMFILACREIHSEYLSSLDDELRSSDKLVNLPGLNPESEDVTAVGEYYGQYQRKLVHLCMDSQPFSD
nr:PREDICTED: WD repeat-containing protein 11 isoform X2 [Nicotiana tabacum]